ncbi:MAG TPA: NUDIX domain-containing protein, partial [Puia sp.]|nr:NUDIX domain-containing protein [Puia sp.]
NQAIMDFGATVCLPRNPLCPSCMQRAACEAQRNGWTTQLPVKEKSVSKKQRWLYYFLVETSDGKVYIRQRTTKDIWEGLFELVLYETDRPAQFDEADIAASDVVRQLFGKQVLTVRHISRVYRQELSHQTIQGRFLTVRLGKVISEMKGYQLVSRKQLAEYPFPKFINGWLRDPAPAQTLF